ncbi:O-fucosyltransferase family protein [Alteriqipengyuania lutimaris]|uniref:Uncharacterized protein n=1 Tax=Alteriqipengyuania lutimaris TaxID=1538146 RepID=A0A395LIN5_9SPHN|nr:hypothetical protein [Alteriqipengyuania lutimaris]MBB3034345.1 hypothetical protein [Alteriqipengyuania lutimaris]RDS76752.1 hypothetical protein DL238_03430 [Alteriqipengyuania lutimaris]
MLDPKIRRKLGALYEPLVKGRHSPPVRLAYAALGALPYLRVRRRGNFHFDLDTPIGMGGLLVHAIQLHSHYDSQGRSCLVRASSPLYSRGDEDIFSTYFERPPWPAGARPVSSAAKAFVTQYIRDEHLDLPTASATFSKYFQPSETLRNAVASASQGRETFDVSIHFRGTDKYLESSIPEYDRMFRELDRILADLPKPSIFLATDDQGFSRAARERYPQATWVSYDMAQLDPDVPRHFSDLPPEDKAIEALVNIFLLARAPICVRTCSYFSAISALIAPDMMTITVNPWAPGKGPFPERQIAEREVRNRA